ncbi:MAG: RNA polymerase sigma factor RpoE [Phycisphaerales bacterium]
MSQVSINIQSEAKRHDPEAELVDRAKAEPEAFGTLYRMHYQAITGYLYRRVGDQSLAEDLSADTFIAAFRSIRKYSSQGVPFRAWLYRIAANKASRWHAKNKKRTAVDISQLVTQEQSQQQSTELVRAAIESLCERDKSIITLAYFTPLNTEQVAETLGIPPGTAKSRLSRARESLAKQIERLGGVT